MSNIEVNYIVIGRTGIILADSQNFYLNTYNFDIKFEATTWMVPEVQVLVYYIHFTGEIIYDVVKIVFENGLPNRVRRLV